VLLIHKRGFFGESHSEKTCAIVQRHFRENKTFVKCVSTMSYAHLEKSSADPYYIGGGRSEESPIRGSLLKSKLIKKRQFSGGDSIQWSFLPEIMGATM